MRASFRVVIPALVLTALAACDSSQIEEKFPEKDATGRWVLPGDTKATPSGGISLLDFGESDVGPEDVITVNRFLWFASLEVLANLPLAFADPYGGVIGTDWHIDPARPNERMKVVAMVSGLELNARALSVRVYRQTRSVGGLWTPEEVSTETTRKIEDSILALARQKRISGTG